MIKTKGVLLILFIEMKTCHAHEEKPKVKSHDTFDGGGYGIFWDEYHSIEQSKMVSTTVAIPDSEDGGAPNKEGTTFY